MGGGGGAPGAGSYIKMGSASSNAKSQTASSLEAGKAAKAKGDIDAQLYELYAQDQLEQGENAIERGAFQALLVQARGKLLAGKARQSAASQGIEANVGTSADIQEQAQKLAAFDAMTIQNNARREALGYKKQAVQARYKAKTAKIEGEEAYQQSVLTAGMQTLNGMVNIMGAMGGG